MDEYRMMLFRLGQQLTFEVATNVANYYKLPASIHDRLRHTNAGTTLISTLEQHCIICEDEDKLRAFHETLTAMRYLNLAEILEDLYPQFKRGPGRLQDLASHTFCPTAVTGQSNITSDVSERTNEGHSGKTFTTNLALTLQIPGVGPEGSNTITSPIMADASESNSTRDVSEKAVEEITALSSAIRMDVYQREALRKFMNKMEDELDPMEVIDYLITLNIFSAEYKTELGSIELQEHRVRQLISKLQGSSRYAFDGFLDALRNCGCIDIVEELEAEVESAKTIWAKNIRGVLTYLSGEERFTFCEMVCNMAEIMTKKEAGTLSDHYTFSTQEKMSLQKSENSGFEVVKLLLDKGFLNSTDQNALKHILEALKLTRLGKILQKYHKSLELPAFQIRVSCPHEFLGSREDTFAFFEINKTLSTLFGSHFDVIFEDFTRENILILRITSLRSLNAVQESMKSGALAQTLKLLLMTKDFPGKCDGLQITCDDGDCNRVRERLLKNAKIKTDLKAAVMSESEFRVFLDGVGLEGFYPAKMTLQMANKIRMLKRCNSPYNTDKADIPLLFLTMLTSLDRRFVLPETLHFNVSVRDFICALFLCSDDFLKQHILEKLSACQLAVPLVIPQPTGGLPTFHLWALRRIVKKWKGDKDCLTPERNVVTEPLFTVAFFRVGQLSVSKSHILNNMFGRAQRNTSETYFISKREDYQHDATFSKGVLEGHWYVPVTGKEGEILNELSLFLNLRGDANAFPQQVEFACKVSDLAIVIVEKEREWQSRELIDHMQNFSSHFIIVCLKKRLKNTNSQVSEKVIIKNNRIEYEVDGEDVVLSKELCEIIKEKSRSSSSENYKCMENWKKICTSLDKQIIVDEDAPLFQRALQKVEEIFNEMKPLNVHHIKERHMPLQKLELEWVKWDQKRASRNKGQTIEYQEDNIRQEKIKIRQKQVECGLSQGMATLFQTLYDVTVGKENVLLHYFMAYFQAQIEAMVKKEIPPHINKIRKFEIDLSQKKRQKAEETNEHNINCLEKEIDKLQKEILFESREYNHKHMGFEHFLRQFSHLVEAEKLLHQNENLENLATVCNLTALAARLLIEGYPLEVLDGDSVYISINWISSILDEVNEVLKFPKVFVISVIGIQSSGKSTLLNCMFGVRFTVRAGKCTRGLYLQMLEVDETLQESLGFQYLLIIDTEGLQSPDRTMHSHFKFDNTLATLAMSIANLSILNISQETIGTDMIGILQIAAHALIRMKKVELSSRCRIVHQRVSDVNAAVENKSSMNVIKDVLDKAAIAAAREENITGIKEFSDILPFTENENLYIPCLWMGNMSAPNHAYSESILNLKYQLLSMIGNKSNASAEPFTLTKFMCRLQDVWDALKKENFVFNFQNSFNALSYQRFRLEHNKWIAVMRTAMVDWELGNKENVKEGKFEVYKGKLHKEIKIQLQNVINEIDEYVTTHSDEDEVNRQSNSFKIFSENIAKEIEGTVLESFHYFLKTEKVKASLPNFIKECKTMLRDKAKAKALEVRRKDFNLDKKSNKASLIREFETQWKETTEKLKIDYEEMRVSQEVIISACENSLMGLIDNTANDLTFREIIKTRGGIVIPDDQSKNAKFRNSVRGMSTGDEKQKVGAKRFLNKYLLGYFTAKDNENRDSSKKQQIKNMAVEELNSFEADNRFEGFDINRIHNLFTAFFEKLRNNMKEEEEFSLKTLVNMCQDVAYLSIEKQRHFEEKFSLYKLMEVEKSSLQTDFMTFFDNEIVTERIAQKTYCDLLNKMTEKVLDYLNVKLLARLRTSNCFIDREYLIGTILCELCTKASVHGYLQFNRNVNNYIIDWLHEKVIEEVTTTEGSNLWIEIAAAEKLNDLKQAIEKCLTGTKEHFVKQIEHKKKVPSSNDRGDIRTSEECNLKIAEWQDTFVNKCKEQKLDIDLEPMIFDSVHYISFTQILLGKIQKTFLSSTNLELKSCKYPTYAEQLVSKMEIKPHLEILKQVQGCSEVCPFCRVGCHRQGEHETHSATLHYPQGLVGFVYVRSNELVVDICTSLVASDCLYKFKDEEEYRPYREYKKEFPNWDIQPIQGDQPSKHWQWVMSKFNKEIAEKFQVKPGIIPDGWKEIKKFEALSSLKRYYSL